jgi:hypothetical protein
MRIGPASTLSTLHDGVHVVAHGEVIEKFNSAQNAERFAQGYNAAFWQLHDRAAKTLGKNLLGKIFHGV